MKKIILVLLALSMLFTVVYAEETSEYKAMLSLVKSRIGNTDIYDEFDGLASTDREGNTVYNFNWHNNDSDLSVEVTADGVITSYNNYKYDSNTSVEISERLNGEKAVNAAKAFFEKLNPHIKTEIKYEFDYSSSSGSYIRINRTHNGIPVYENSGTIQISHDGKTLKWMNFTYTSNADFQNCSDIISKDDAKKAFNDKLGFELTYHFETKDDEIKIYPVYAVKDSGNRFISAVNGDILQYNYRYELFNGALQMYDVAEEESAYGAVNKYSQAEIDELDEIKAAISKNDAIKIIKKNKYIPVPDYAYDDCSISEYKSNNKREYAVILSWGDEKYAHVNISGETGEILSFSINQADKKEPSYTRDEMKKSASDAVSYLAGEKCKQYQLKDDEETKNLFIFVRYVNGIPFYKDNIYVSVNDGDNSVSSYSIGYTDEEFPELKDIVSYDEASSSYFDISDYDVTYMYIDNKFEPVYKLSDESVEIDAYTGKEIKKIDGNYKIAYNDTEGHYCENAATALAEYNIGFASDVLEPDKPILQKEFAALIRDIGSSVIISEEYDYEWLYQRRISDIIDKDRQNPDGTVSRLDAAEFTVKAMGLGDVGRLDIFRPMFKDLSENTGYAGILCGMKILNGDGKGNFNPDKTLTRGQALIIIYNYMNK